MFASRDTTRPLRGFPPLLMRIAVEQKLQTVSLPHFHHAGHVWLVYWRGSGVVPAGIASPARLTKPS